MSFKDRCKRWWDKLTGKTLVDSQPLTAEIPADALACEVRRRPTHCRFVIQTPHRGSGRRMPGRR